jgi:hypothetical protein
METQETTMSKKRLLVLFLIFVIFASLIAIAASWNTFHPHSTPIVTPSPTQTATPTPSVIENPSPTPEPTETPSPTPMLTPSPTMPVPTTLINQNGSVTITVSYRNPVTYLLPWYSNSDNNKMVFYYGIDSSNSTYLDVSNPSGWPDQGFPAKQGVYESFWGDQITVSEVQPTYLVILVEHVS